MNLRLYRHPLLRNRCLSQQRWLSSSTVNDLTAKHSIYISNSTNPYFNLTLEDWLFTHKDPERPLLLVYRDEPCVVIGRNQNPWKEVNLQVARLRRVPFLRRRSGGGAVYHDLGNSNYSLHLSRTSFSREETAKLVIRAISGSAYKIVRERAYHHGTMLISTRLDTLGDLLHTTKETMTTRGVASVRSPVQNLQRFKPSITHEGFVEALVRTFQEAYDVDEEAQYIGETESILNSPEIQKGMEELKSWNWLYGQTPEFTYTVSRLFDFGLARAEITSKHGVILACKVDCRGLHPETLDRVNKRMIDMRYGSIKAFEDIDWDWNDPEPGERQSGGGSDIVDGDSFDNPLGIREIWNWIREETSS